MKALKGKILIMIGLLLVSGSILFGQGNYNLEIEQEVVGSELIMDLYVQRTSGTDFAFSSSNFAVFIDTAILDIDGLTREVPFDGPWDNGTVPASYLDMSLGHGPNFINLTTRRNTSGSTTGFPVTTDRTRIGRIKIPIKNACASYVARWNSAPAAQSMMPLVNIKSYANFVDAPDFPLCEMPAVPALTNLSGVDTICEGDVVELSTDISGNDIQWYKDGQPIDGETASKLVVSESGEYKVEAVNCICKTTSNSTKSVFVKPLPEKPVIEENGNVLTTQHNGELQWYLDGTVIDGANSDTYEPLESGAYTVRAVNDCGETESEPLQITIGGISSNIELALDAYPNPFLEQTKITYSVPSSTNVRIELYDILGKKLMDLDSGMKTKGTHVVSFNGYDKDEGVYFVKLTVGDEYKTLKLVELK